MDLQTNISEPHRFLEMQYSMLVRCFHSSLTVCAGTLTFKTLSPHQGRRLLLKAYIEKDDCYPVYNYLFTQNTAGLPPAYLPPAYGVWHYSETFLGKKASFSSLDSCKCTLTRHAPKVYGLYAALFPNNTVGAVSNYMSSAWIAFANNLQPNRPNRE